MQAQNLRTFFNFVKSIRKTEELLGSGEKKPTKLELKTRKIVRKSIVAKFEIKKGKNFLKKILFQKDQKAVFRLLNGKNNRKTFKV